MNESVPVLAQSLKLLNVLPTVVGNPSVRFAPLNIIEGSVTFEEEVQLNLVENIGSIHDHRDHLEREHQLVLLEDTHASEVVDQYGQPVLDDSESVRQDAVRARCVKSLVEYSHVRGQGVLVHILDVRQSCDGEEENGSSPGHISVAITIGLDIRVGDGGILKCCRNFDRL